MAQQYLSKGSQSPARASDSIVEKPVSKRVCVKGSNSIGKTETGTHFITKITNPKSHYYSCDQCNTAYRSFKQVSEDHPDFDVKNLIEYVKPKETGFVF